MFSEYDTAGVLVAFLVCFLSASLLSSTIIIFFIRFHDMNSRYWCALNVINECNSVLFIFGQAQGENALDYWCPISVHPHFNFEVLL